MPALEARPGQKVRQGIFPIAMEHLPACDADAVRVSLEINGVRPCARKIAAGQSGV